MVRQTNLNRCATLGRGVQLTSDLCTTVSTDARDVANCDQNFAGTFSLT